MCEDCAATTERLLKIRAGGRRAERRARVFQSRLTHTREVLSDLLDLPSEEYDRGILDAVLADISKTLTNPYEGETS